jgi:hypothetical protein
MAAETLAAVSATEDACFVQTWLHEITNPHLDARDLVNASGSELCHHDLGVDCNDLYATLTQPAFPNPSNRALTLYLSLLRDLKERNFIRANIWVDTKDNVANVLTKLCPDGTLPMTELSDLLRRCFWEPVHPFRWNGMLTEPAKPVHVPINIKMPTKPPPTSTATATDVTYNDTVHYTHHYDITYTDNDGNYDHDNDHHDTGEEAVEDEKFATVYNYDWNGCDDAYS